LTKYAFFIILALIQLEC